MRASNYRGATGIGDLALAAIIPAGFTVSLMTKGGPVFYSTVFAIVFLRLTVSMGADFSGLIRWMWAMVAILAAAFMSVVYSLSPPETLIGATRLAGFISIAWIYYDISRRREVSLPLLIAVVLSVIFVATMLTIAYIYARYGVVRSVYKWVDDIGSYSNVASYSVGIIVPAMVGLILYVRPSIIAEGAVTLAAVMLFFVTENRAGLVLVPLGLVIVWGYNRRYGRVGISVAGTIAILVLAAEFGSRFYAISHGGIHRLIERLGQSEIISALIRFFVPSYVPPETGLEDTLRAWMYEHALNSLQAHPVLGLGFGTFNEATLRGLGISIPSHTIVVTMMAELGGLGIVLGILFAAQSLELCWRVHRCAQEGYVSRAIAGGVIASFMVGIAYMLIRPPFDSPYWFIFYGLAAGICERALRAGRPAPVRRVPAHRPVADGPGLQPKAP